MPFDDIVGVDDLSILSKLWNENVEDLEGCHAICKNIEFIRCKNNESIYMDQ